MAHQIMPGSVKRLCGWGFVLRFPWYAAVSVRPLWFLHSIRVLPVKILHKVHPVVKRTQRSIDSLLGTFWLVNGFEACPCSPRCQVPIQKGHASLLCRGKKDSWRSNQQNSCHDSSSCWRWSDALDPTMEIVVSNWAKHQASELSLMVQIVFVGAVIKFLSLNGKRCSDPARSLSGRGG
jgi:hypothetical protein